MHHYDARHSQAILCVVLSIAMLVGCATTPGRDKPLSPVMAVAVAPDDGLIAVSTDASEIALFDRSPLSFRALLTTEGAKSKPAFEMMFQSPSLAFSPDAGTLVAAEPSGKVLGWDVRSRSQRFTVPFGERVSDVVFFPDGRRFITAGPSVVLWNSDKGDRVGTLQLPSGGTATSAAVSPDGQVILVGLSNGEIAIYSAATMDLAGVIKAHHCAVTGLAFAPDGRTIASCGGRYDPRLCEIPPGSPPVECIAGSPPKAQSQPASSGTLEVIGFLAQLLGAARGWQIVGAPTPVGATVGSGHTGSDGTMPPKHCGPRLAFSPDGRYLATVANVSSLSGEWDLVILDRAGHETNRIPGVYGCSVAFTPDGRYVVTGGLGAPQIWNVATGKKANE